MMTINGLILAWGRKKVFCHTFLVFAVRSGTFEKEFIIHGFSDWNHATHKFKLHQSTDCLNQLTLLCQTEELKAIINIPKLILLISILHFQDTENNESKKNLVYLIHLI